MLKPAKLYEEELNRKYIETWYDERYKYYVIGNGKCEISLPDNNNNSHHFVCVDKNENLIGYFSYNMDLYSEVVFGIGWISFDEGNLLFVMDVMKHIDELFFKQHINKIEFSCLVGNPARKFYRRMLNKYGGKVCGYKTQTVRINGSFYDEELYELFYVDYALSRLERKNKKWNNTLKDN